MSDTYTYKEYVGSRSFYKEYSAYQKKYAFNARESDKKIIDLVREEKDRHGMDALRILDIGCSTGNLLYHVKQQFPDERLCGGDLMVYVVEECRRNPMLAGMDFEVMDICSLPRSGYDVVIANAIMFMLDDAQYENAARSIYHALDDGGLFIGYEWMHEYHSEISITEKSNLHPDGLVIHSRPFWSVRELYESVGFTDVRFLPFEIPIDLPALTGREQELVTRTVKTGEGSRLMFRGPLFQPWCHMTARKP